MRRKEPGRLQRAVQLFTLADWESDSELVDRAWSARSEPEPFFISVAASQWRLVVTTRHDRAQVTIRGPETRATITAIPEDAEFFGIAFRIGTFAPALPLDRLVDRALTLPAATSRSVWIDGSRWEIPTPANADVFVDRLVASDVIVRDPVVADWLQGDIDAAPTRTLQRRVARATGLTRRTIRQIARAEGAVDALERGLSPPEVATRLGFADQAHLTRSLRRFVGQTPARVAASRAR
jgi:Helix-turn-helix domain